MSFENTYMKNYKKLLIIPLIILTLSIIILLVQYSTNGYFIDKDISLKGGVSSTIYTQEEINIEDIESKFLEQYPGSEISIRKLSSFGTSQKIGIIIEATEVNAEQVRNFVQKNFNTENFSIQETGEGLGESFFKELIYAIIFAFGLMIGIVILIFVLEKTLSRILGSILLFLVIIIDIPIQIKAILSVIFIIFVILLTLVKKKFIISLPILFSIIFDILCTLAIISLLNMKISSAGIAAFLMVIGYSIDTDLLLTTRILRRKIGTIFERLKNAFKTGIMMTITTLAALSVAYFITNSIILKQMFGIIIIALTVDLISTWITTSGLIIWYAKKNENK